MHIDMKEWVDTARRYGAVFDNVALINENESFTVRAIDKKKESLLYVPFPVLLPMEAIEISDKHHYVHISFDIEPDLRAMLNAYLDFILSDERIIKLEKLINNFMHLSSDLKKELRHFGFAPLFIKMSRKEKKMKLVQARTINMNGKKVFMPFIDFMNHSFEEGIAFNIGKDAIAIRGVASPRGELFSIYNNVSDPFSYLYTYLFVPQALNAFSMIMGIMIDAKTELVIARQYDKIKISKRRFIEQKYSVSKNKITIPTMWLGSRVLPRNPFWSFKKLWEEELHRTDTQLAYSLVKSRNIIKLVHILRLCGKEEGSDAVAMIRESTLQQLRLIGEGFEELR